jgi:hypothetical protein
MSSLLRVTTFGAADLLIEDESLQVSVRMSDGQWRLCAWRGGGMSGDDSGWRCDKSYARPDGEVTDIEQVRVEFELHGRTASRILERAEPS